MAEISILLAFGAGLLSFFSPCVLPLYPAFLSYITGVSVAELKKEKGAMKKSALIHTVLFLIGFSIIFLALGLSTSFIGSFFFENTDLLRQMGAILMVLFGLVLTGVLKFDFLLSDKKVHFQKRPTGYVGSVVIGIGFAAGWTPCTGPTLAAVIALGIADPSRGLLYMLVYVLGFAVPFLLMSFFIEKMTFLKKRSAQFMAVGGSLMVFIGVMLFFDMMTAIISFLSQFTGGFIGF